MRRALEIVFGHGFQMLLLVLLIPAVAIAYSLTLPRSYQSTSTLWALRRYQVIGATGVESNLQSTPAVTQTDAITELLHTQVFAVAVGKEANLASTFPASVRANLEQSDAAIFGDISTKVVAADIGTNVFSVSYTNRDPHMAQLVVQAVIHNFGLQSTGFSVVAGQQVLQSYQSQLADAQKAADAAVAAEQQYLAQHPTLTAAAAQSDPRYALLHSQTQQAQATVQGIQSQIAQLNQDISSQGGGPDGLYKVLDSPNVPTRPTSRSKTLLLAGGAGLGGALLLCAIYVTVLARRDRTAYTPADLAQATHYPVVMQLSHIPRISPSLPLSGALVKQRGSATSDPGRAADR